MRWAAYLGGHIHVLRDGQDLGPPPFRTVGVLLVGLLSRPKQWFTRAEIADLLYPGDEKGRIALRQTLTRLRRWLGPDVLEESAGAIRLKGDWDLDFEVGPGVQAKFNQIASTLDHPWLDLLRYELTPPESDYPTPFDLVASAVTSTLQVDQATARGMLVGAEALLWDRPMSEIDRLMSLVRPQSIDEPHAVEYLELSGLFAGGSCSARQSIESLQRAYEAATEKRQFGTAERIAAYLVFQSIEFGKVGDAKRWYNTIASRTENDVLTLNAISALAWNQGDSTSALAIMRSAERLLHKAEHRAQMHYWANLAVLAAEAGEVGLSREAAATCENDEGPGTKRWQDNLRLAAGIREMAGGEYDHATATLRPLVDKCHDLGWKLTAAYALEALALAEAQRGRRADAIRCWNMASAHLRARCNGRRRVLRQRIQACL